MYLKHYIKSKFYLILLSLVLTFNLSYGNEKIPIEQLKAFSEVYMKIKKDYVEKVDDEKLFDDAIKGMLEGLDPHSDEYSEEVHKRMKVAFPHKFDNSGDKPTTKTVQSVASAKRTTKTGRKQVRLTSSQVAIAKKLGVQLEEYAKQLKLTEGA